MGKITKGLSTVRFQLTLWLAVSFVVITGVAPHAYTEGSPNGFTTIFVLLRGGADIQFQMVQPDLNSALSLPLNRVRPNIYDVNINSRLLNGTGFGYHEDFPILGTIHNTSNDLALVRRVGISNLPSSHTEAELAWARCNPDALSGPSAGVLQRLAQQYFTVSGDLIDLSGGHPITTGGSFTPLQLYRIQQTVSTDANVDGVLMTRENLFRLSMYLRAMQQTPQNENASLDAVQQAIAKIGDNDGIIRIADNAIPAGYQTNAAGMLFRDAEIMIRETHKSGGTASAKVIFGVIDERDARWDTHVNQNASGGQFQTAVARLNSALSTFRANTLVDGMWSKTAIVIFSEMGRGTVENLQLGTDHGLSNAVLVIGGRVFSGLFGAAPSVTQIEDDSGVIPHDLTCSDVFADIFFGMGYDPTPIFPGYSRRALSLLSGS